MNQEKKTYNGWCNYETWLVHLRLTNDQGPYFHWRERAKEIAEKNDPKEGNRSALSRLAEEICDVIKEECASQKTSLAADMMNAALGEVDWHEIAKEFLDDVVPIIPGITETFSLGLVVATPGVLRSIALADRMEALSRHAQQDWGDVDPEDRAENDNALKEGSRLFSVYHSCQGIKFWIITEADRSVTTFLLPEEY